MKIWDMDKNQKLVLTLKKKKGFINIFESSKVNILIKWKSKRLTTFKSIINNIYIKRKKFKLLIH